MSRTDRGTSPIAGILAAVAALLVTALLALAMGSVPIAFRDMLTAVGIGPEREISGAASYIIRLVRLPRVVTAAGAGAALGLAGLTMQTVFRNALAGPGVLGVSAGAGLGVAIVLLTGVGASAAVATVPAAMVGAALVLVAAIAVNRAVGHPVLLLVMGLLFGYAANAVTTLLLASAPGQGLERYIVWSFGSFALPPGPGPILLPMAAGLTAVGLAVAGPRVDALLLGPYYAESSGVHARRTQAILIVVAGGLTGLVTAYTGPISFLGVAVPHIARGWIGRSQHRLLVPATAIIGGWLAIAADLVARLPGNERVLPLNAVMALVGVPVVLVILLRGRRSGDGEGIGL
ncbi:MAG TPA: iron ABC transporter permease [Alkalispirochaeta sp.]|nr:iron ABC transporter permease [Alkalispirochaeta sp.]